MDNDPKWDAAAGVAGRMKAGVAVVIVEDVESPLTGKVAMSRPLLIQPHQAQDRVEEDRRVLPERCAAALE